MLGANNNVKVLRSVYTPVSAVFSSSNPPHVTMKQLRCAVCGQFLSADVLTHVFYAAWLTSVVHLPDTQAAVFDQ